MRIDKTLLFRCVVIVRDHEDRLGTLLIVLDYAVPAFTIIIRRPTVIVNPPISAKRTTKPRKKEHGINHAPFVAHHYLESSRFF